MSILFTLSGCLTSKRIDGWISEKYAVPVQKQRKNDYLAVKMQNATPDNTVSTTKKEKTKVLPLLFYWRFDYAMNSTLNPAK